MRVEAAVVETVFERSYSATSRLAAVRAATIATLYGRGSWRTFSERVVANRMTSLVRSMRSERSGRFREEPIENLLGLAAPNDGADLRADVARVLAGMSPFDRSVAMYLVGHSAIETGQRLGVCRATVYRAIGRLRTAFTEAGLSPWGCEYACDSERAAGE